MLKKYNSTVYTVYNKSCKKKKKKIEILSLTFLSGGKKVEYHSAKITQNTLVTA